MIPVSLSPDMNSPVIQDDITSCTDSSSSSSESEDEKAAATKVCKDTDIPVAKKAKRDAAKPVGTHSRKHVLTKLGVIWNLTNSPVGAGK